MDRASDAPVVASAGTQAEPRTPASWLLSAGRFQTAAPLPVGSDPRSVPRTEPVHIAPLPSSPALGRYAKGLPAAVILLRRNRTDRPLNEGFLLRRLHFAPKRLKYQVIATDRVRSLIPPLCSLIARLNSLLRRKNSLLRCLGNWLRKSLDSHTF